MRDRFSHPGVLALTLLGLMLLLGLMTVLWAAPAAWLTLGSVLTGATGYLLRRRRSHDRVGQTPARQDSRTGNSVTAETK